MLVRPVCREQRPWNKGLIIGQKKPLESKMRSSELYATGAMPLTSEIPDTGLRGQSQGIWLLRLGRSDPSKSGNEDAVAVPQMRCTRGAIGESR